MQFFETEKLVYFAVADEYDEQKTDWTWIIDFYNIKNRLPILETFLKYHAKPR